jgi:hypothetical protein
VIFRLICIVGLCKIILFNQSAETHKLNYASHFVPKDTLKMADQESAPKAPCESNLKMGSVLKTTCTRCVDCILAPSPVCAKEQATMAQDIIKHLLGLGESPPFETQLPFASLVFRDVSVAKDNGKTMIVCGAPNEESLTADVGDLAGLRNLIVGFIMLKRQTFKGLVKLVKLLNRVDCVLVPVHKDLLDWGAHILEEVSLLEEPETEVGQQRAGRILEHATRKSPERWMNILLTCAAGNRDMMGDQNLKQGWDKVNGITEAIENFNPDRDEVVYLHKMFNTLELMMAVRTTQVVNDQERFLELLSFVSAVADVTTNYLHRKKDTLNFLDLFGTKTLLYRYKKYMDLECEVKLVSEYCQYDVDPVAGEEGASCDLLCKYLTDLDIHFVYTAVTAFDHNTCTPPRWYEYLDCCMLWVDTAKKAAAGNQTAVDELETLCGLVKSACCNMTSAVERNAQLSAQVNKAKQEDKQRHETLVRANLVLNQAKMREMELEAAKRDVDRTRERLVNKVTADETVAAVAELATEKRKKAELVEKFQGELKAARCENAKLLEEIQALTASYDGRLSKLTSDNSELRRANADNENRITNLLQGSERDRTRIESMRAQARTAATNAAAETERAVRTAVDRIREVDKDRHDKVVTTLERQLADRDDRIGRLLKRLDSASNTAAAVSKAVPRLSATAVAFEPARMVLKSPDPVGVSPKFMKKK